METGNYGTDSELIREALREKQLRMNELDALRTKLIAAELSVEQHGWINESPQEMLDGFKEKARHPGRNGRCQKTPPLISARAVA